MNNQQRKDQPAEQRPNTERNVQKPSLTDRKSAILKERAWADQTEAPNPEPYEETYRDGRLKNECW